MAVENAEPGAVKSSRTLIAAGVTLAVAGIAISVSELRDIGSWLTVGALVIVILGVHRFGRSGPDA
jgi:hypothetical protein